MTFPRASIAPTLATALFVGLLATPLVGQLISSGSTTSETERRALAAAPPVSEVVTDWPAYPEQVNAWMNDHVGFRRELIRLYGAVERELELELEVRGDAVRGDDGWLFATVNSALAMHQGLKPFVGSEAEAWLNRLAELRARSQEAGAVFVVLTPPNKHSVYPEHLSNYPRRAAGEGRLEALERLAPQFGVTLINPRDALIAAKARRTVFYRTDTHWTTYGAYVGYLALMEALIERGVETRVLDDEGLGSATTDTFAGDLYGLLGVEDGQPETVEEITLRSPSPIAENILLEAYEYGPFKARRFVMEPRGLPSVLVLGDSFSMKLLPYLRESFDEVTYLHHRSGAAPLEVIEPGRYDVVVFQIVERLLSSPPRDD